jgi:hypothetical protein
MQYDVRRIYRVLMASSFLPVHGDAVTRVALCKNTPLPIFRHLNNVLLCGLVDMMSPAAYCSLRTCIKHNCYASKHCAVGGFTHHTRVANIKMNPTCWLVNQTQWGKLCKGPESPVNTHALTDRLLPSTAGPSLHKALPHCRSPAVPPPSNNHPPRTRGQSLPPRMQVAQHSGCESHHVSPGHSVVPGEAV